MIYKTIPEQFHPRFEIVSCFVEHEGTFLLLQRSHHTSQPNKWGVVAGKIDPGEIPKEAMVRELMEETGLRIPTQELTYIDKVFVKYPAYDFIFHMFRAIFKKQPKVRINPREHEDFQWALPQDALMMDLVLDADECIKLYYGL